MSDLTRREKLRLEKALGMGSGYVLQFSNRTFAEFFQDALGIDIYDEKYGRGSGSKANRMRAFWDQESNESVAKVIDELIKEYAIPPQKPLPPADEEALHDIAQRLKKTDSSFVASQSDQKADKPLSASGSSETASAPIAFISYKWESDSHQEWVRKIATDLRARGVDAKLDQWEVRPGDSFTDYMQHNMSKADVILFVITDEAVRAAEAPGPQGGALKFEVQMMNARRMAEGTRIIGIYRSGDRPPHYLRDHRYINFRNDQNYEEALSILVEGIFGRGGPPPISTIDKTAIRPPSRPRISLSPVTLSDGGELRIEIVTLSVVPVTWLNRSLNGPRGNIYSSGSSWAFEQTSPNVWTTSWSENISPWAPSGEYSLSGVSVRNTAELTSEDAPPITFIVTNSKVSNGPSIESVLLSSHRISPGGSIKIAIRACSRAPVNWLDRSLGGPRGSLYGGSSTAPFLEVEPNIWLLEWTESFSVWAPTGQYVLSKLRVKNEAELQSEEWPEIQFHLVSSQ